MISESQVKAILPPSGFLRSYVDWAERCADSHLIYHVAAALSLLSMSLPRDYFFPFGGKLRANFYTLCVGDSTKSRKTAAINLAAEVLREAFPDREMEHPGSPEALVDELIERSQRLLLLAEFGSFLAQTETGQLSSIRARLTEIYDAQPVSRRLVRRKGDEAVCKDPRLSIIGGVAPDFLEDHTSEGDWGGGFLARFCTFLAKRERLLDEPLHDPAGLTRLAEMLRGFLPDPFRDGSTMPKPCTGFSPRASALWRDWNRSVESRAVHPKVRAAVARAPGHALKMAMILAWDVGAGRSGAAWELDAPELNLATQLTETHIESVLALADGFAADRDMRDRRRVLRAVNGHPTTFGEIIRTAQVTARRGREMIETLTAERSIVRVPVEGSTEPAYTLPDVSEPSLGLASTGLPVKSTNPFE